MVQLLDLFPALRCHARVTEFFYYCATIFQFIRRGLAAKTGISRSNFPQGGLYFPTIGEMADPPITDTTRLLRDWAGGDPEALKQLTPRVYQELRRMAAHFLQNERPGCTLQSVDLVHEVYLRLIDVKQVDWQHRAHFLAVSATLMRRILLDRARRRSAAKRGGKQQIVNLDAGLGCLLRACSRADCSR